MPGKNKAILWLLALGLALTAPAMESVVIFRSGEHGVDSCRIPALVSTRDDALFAVAEGRKTSWKDKSPTCLLGSVSEDGGRTWSQPSVVADAGDDALMDPCPVYDAATGTISLFCVQWRRTEGKIQPLAMLSLVSKDGGRHWSKPSALPFPSWLRSCAVLGLGPGSGMTMAAGPSRGRLVIPMRYALADGQGGCRSLYSDDHGGTWKFGREATPDLRGECQIAEAQPGVLLVNVRVGAERRQARSLDGGETWTSPSVVPGLVSPRKGCHGALLSYPGMANALLFSGPDDADSRKNLAVWLSGDGGNTWPARIHLGTRAAGYSSLALLPGGDVGLAYEAGPGEEFSTAATRPPGWMEIVFVRLPASEIRAATPSAAAEKPF